MATRGSASGGGGGGAAAGGGGANAGDGGPAAPAPAPSSNATPMSPRVIQRYEALHRDLVAQAVNGDSSPACRTLLKELRKVYAFNSVDEVLQLQTVFLRLLDASARSIALKRNLERKLHFGVIVSLLLREEFRYASLTARIEDGQFDVLAGYTHQLSVCTRETVDCLQDVNEYSDAATINSCMKIMAIAFIRLPNFRAIYTAQLTDELAALAACPEDDAQARSTRNVLEACDKYERVAEIASKDELKRRAFATANPDVFGWKEVEELMRARCPSAELKAQFEADRAELAERLAANSPRTGQTFHVALKSNEGFYYFLTNYLKVCRFNMVDAREVVWYCLPAYKRLIRRYIFSRLDASRYTCPGRRSRAFWTPRQLHAMFDCTALVLDNKAMLNVLIVIIFENTNMHDLRCVESTISELERWFVIASGKSGGQDGGDNSYMHMVIKRIKDEKTLDTNAKRVFSGRALVDWLLQYEGDKFGGKPGDQDKDNDDDSDVAEAGVAPHSALVDGVVVDAVMGGAGGVIGQDRDFARSFCDDMQQSGEIISLQKNVAFEDSEEATYRLSAREFEIEEAGEDQRGLPASFDLDYFTDGICQLLEAEHFQVVLKTLSFIYNQTVLFHGAFREKLVTEILLKGFFFRLFLHWMHEIRRYFLHILVFKIFRTPRKMLPCNIDKELLDQGAKKNTIQSGLNKLRDNIANLRKKDKKGAGLSWMQALSTALFNPKKCAQVQEAAENQVYEDSLQSEQLAIDLMLASKVDSYTQLILAQSQSESATTLGEIPQELVVYVPSALEQYKKILQAYYDACRDNGGGVPASPPLHFKVIDKHSRR